MKNILFLGLFVFLITSCDAPSSGSEEQGTDSVQAVTDTEALPQEEEAEPAEEENLPLESLLKYGSEQELIEKFGQENVQRSVGYLPEGLGEFPVTSLYKGTPKEVSVEWEDTVGFTQVFHVTIAGTENEWKSKAGVYLGMGINELTELNGGQAVKFSGFGWDYGGYANLDENSPIKEGVSLRFDLSPETYENMPEEYNGLMGDIELSSDMELVKKANPVVVSIQVYVPR